MIPILANVGERDNERVQRGMNQFGSLLSAITKKVKNSKFQIHSTSNSSALGPAIWKFISNTFSVISKDRYGPR